MPEVYFTRPGHRDLQKLPSPLRDRIKGKLRDVREHPDRHLKRLSGYDLYVLRVGEHRIIIDWDRRAGILYVHAIGHRRNIYDQGL